MDVHKMLDELRRERDILNHVIQVLETLERGQSHRRGRPLGVKNKNDQQHANNAAASPQAKLAG